MGRHGYRGDGAFGQFSLVLPDLDAVVAMTAATEDMQRVLDAVHHQLLPGFEPPDEESAADELSTRLADLSLPPARGEETAPASVSLPWVRSAPARGIQVTRLESQGPGWRLTFADDQYEYDIRCGSGTWAESETSPRPGTRLRVAASAAWLPAGAFVAEVIFVETPHRLTLTCNLTTGVTEARWNVTPLGDVTISELALDLDRF